MDRSISFIGQSHNYFIRAKADYLKKLAAACQIQRYSRVLDVGCGVGLIDAYLQGYFGQLHGVDVADGVIEKARARNPFVKYIAYDGAQLPYEAGAFDFTFTVNVMHHIEHAQLNAFLQEIKGVTKKNGLITIFEHNPNNPLTRLAVSRCAFDQDAALVPKGTLTRMLEDMGINPIAQKYILLFPTKNPLFDDLERHLAWSPLGAQYYVAGRNEFGFENSDVVQIGIANAG